MAHASVCAWLMRACVAFFTTFLLCKAFSRYVFALQDVFTLRFHAARSFYTAFLHCVLALDMSMFHKPKHTFPEPKHMFSEPHNECVLSHIMCVFVELHHVFHCVKIQLIVYYYPCWYYNYSCWRHAFMLYELFLSPQLVTKLNNMKSQKTNNNKLS